jgi:hypothetical protein
MSNDEKSENKATTVANEKKIAIPYENIESSISLRTGKSVTIAMNVKGNYGLALWYPIMKGDKMAEARMDIHGTVTSAQDLNQRCPIDDGVSIFCTCELDNYKLAIHDTQIVITATCKSGERAGHILQWFLSRPKK